MGLKRQSATYAPADAPPERTLAERIAALDDADSDVRRRAALDLSGEYDFSEDDAISALVSRVQVEKDRSVREAILTTLAEFDDVEVAARIVPLLRSDDAALRSAVVDALAQMPTGTSAVMDKLVRSSDSDIRILAVMVMGVLHHPRVPEWLATLIEHDPHPNVVSAAVSELAEVGDSSHVALIRAAVQRFPDDGFLAFCATQAEACFEQTGS